MKGWISDITAAASIIVSLAAFTFIANAILGSIQ